MSKQEGITAKKEGDFSEWYQQLIIKGDLADYSSVSGCIVFKPKGLELWEKIKQEVDKRLKKIGVKNAYFPLLIPEQLLSKEKTHIEGFSPEVAWVTEAGNTKLSERLAIRPTSETIMYDSYSKWIRSWRDLPLKLNQWNSVIRWEFKHPVPFLRTREFLWNEGHTVFASKKEAEAEGKQILKIYNDVLRDYMALPGLIGKKSEKEKFAGAEYTHTIELYLPNGKAIQGPDFHHDGQNFAKAYNIKFLDKNGKEEYAWQNTWAITTRMIGVMIAIHSDDKGLIIPPNMIENKIVIIPILFEDSKDKVMKHAKEIEKKLKKFGIFIDSRDYKPGWKFNEWELKGIPIRIEIGPKDIEKKEVVITRRDNSKKENVKIKDLNKYIEETITDIQNEMYKKANKLLKSNIIKADTIKDFKEGIRDKKLVLVPFCNNPMCENNVKDKYEGVKSLNSPLDEKFKKSKCLFCDKETEEYFYFGKSY